MRRLFLGAIILLLAARVEAASWYINCGDPATQSPVAGLPAGSFVCASPASNTDDTDVIAVTACDNIDVLSFQDKVGSGSTALTSGTFQLCPGAGASLTSAPTACFNAPNTTAPMAANGAIYGASGVWVRIKAGGTNTNPTNMRWIIRCGMPTR